MGGALRENTAPPASGWGEGGKRLTHSDKTTSPALLAAADTARDLRQHGRDRMLHDMTRDPLTGLLDRSAFQSLAARIIASADPVALVLIDLDHFKLINDGLGHDWGDTLLKEVARRFAQICPKAVLLGRLGGDEFTVLLASDQPMIDASLLADRLRDSLRPAVTLDGRGWSVSCSIGVAAASTSSEQSNGPDRQTVGDLLRDAEVAMYRAKDGRDRTVIFDPTMHEAALARLDLEAGLHDALERDEFVLHLQPLVRLEDGRLKGFEALARWMRPGHGLVMPSVFISVLEDTGLVIPFGYWIVRQACAILQDWQSRFPNADLPALSINLSARQFEDPALFETICGIVTESGIAPSSLRLEIVESLLMQKPERVADILGRFKKLGFGISLDDFGTGYSSLGYLQSFPVDSLKIDRSFVARMQEEGGNLRIVRAILGLAASLGLAVVGEGIETAEQADLLRKFGCDYGQGYHFARPLSLADATCLVGEASKPRALAAEPPAHTDAPENACAPGIAPSTRIRWHRQSRATRTGSQEASGRSGWTTRKVTVRKDLVRLLRPCLLIALFMTVHAALLLTFPERSSTLSALCMVVGPAAASAACWKAARSTKSGLQANWRIAALAFLFWAAGSLLAVWLPMSSEAGVVDFAYFLCSASLLFAMTAPENDRPRWLFLLMDSLQTVLCAFLGYIVIFGAVPFTSERVIPLGPSAILWTYDCENGFMALLAALRLFGGDGSPARRRFDVAILVFTLTFGALGSLYDHISPATSSPFDVMLDPAFFLFAAVTAAPLSGMRIKGRRTPSLVAFLNTLGPVIVTAAVLLVAAWIATQRPLPGFLGIIATVSLYALRVSLLQARYIVTQQHLGQTRSRLQILALEDGLTGVGNRRAFDTALAALWAAATSDNPFAVLLIDVDFFKAYNDRHGHLMGDTCLAAVARELKIATQHAGGVVTRYGGEEFVVLLPDTAGPSAQQAAFAIREIVAALRFTSDAGAPAPITVSIGVATSHRASSARALMLAADDALYRAKRKGRDRVEVEPLDLLIAA